ncbi:MAG TPA: thiolase domain-containing protein [Actinomycetota bacterium]|nr:thiolase domain-containing protein [Actinomycetota bacterium]
MRDVAVVGFAQTPSVSKDERNEVEMIMPVLHEAVQQSGIPRQDIGFTVSGSCDFLIGQPFSFVGGLDAVGAWPPIRESHVEMDAAWALYEAWVKLQTGEVDSALVYGFGKSSPGDLQRVLAMQLDPYLLGPLWPGAISLAALQARAYLEATGKTERDLADVAARSRRDAANNPNAQVSGETDLDSLLAEPPISSPLRRHDCPPSSDGAAAVVLAADDVARSASDRPAWIRSIDHRIEPHQFGSRDLTRSASTEQAAHTTGVSDGPVDVAEVHAPFTHQELILRDALGLNGDTAINPSGGALTANPLMAAGLIRIGEAATAISEGRAGRAVAHATSGPCLQQNLVCVLERTA